MSVSPRAAPGRCHGGCQGRRTCTCWSPTAGSRTRPEGAAFLRHRGRSPSPLSTRGAPWLPVVRGASPRSQPDTWTAREAGPPANPGPRSSPGPRGHRALNRAAVARRGRIGGDQVSRVGDTPGTPSVLEHVEVRETRAAAFDIADRRVGEQKMHGWSCEPGQASPRRVRVRTRLVSRKGSTLALMVCSWSQRYRRVGQFSSLGPTGGGAHPPPSGQQENWGTGLTLTMPRGAARSVPKAGLAASVQ